MRRVPDPVRFATAFVVLTLALGWLSWRATASPQLAPLRNTMVLVPALSAMLAANGFSWRRKAVYAGVTLLGYTGVGLLAVATGFNAFADGQVRAGMLPSPLTSLYLAVLTTYPFVVLVLFVGRSPARLWRA